MLLRNKEYLEDDLHSISNTDLLIPWRHLSYNGLWIKISGCFFSGGLIVLLLAYFVVLMNSIKCRSALQEKRKKEEKGVC